MTYQVSRSGSRISDDWFPTWVIRDRRFASRTSCPFVLASGSCTSFSDSQSSFMIAGRDASRPTAPRPSAVVCSTVFHCWSTAMSASKSVSTADWTTGSA